MESFQPLTVVVTYQASYLDHPAMTTPFTEDKEDAESPIRPARLPREDNKKFFFLLSFHTLFLLFSPFNQVRTKGKTFLHASYIIHSFQLHKSQNTSSLVKNKKNTDTISLSSFVLFISRLKATERQGVGTRLKQTKSPLAW